MYIHFISYPKFSELQVVFFIANWSFEYHRLWSMNHMVLGHFLWQQVHIKTDVFENKSQNTTKYVVSHKERLQTLVKILATLVVGFLLHRQVGKELHGTETSHVIMFSSHMWPEFLFIFLPTSHGQHMDIIGIDKHVSRKKKNTQVQWVCVYI